MRSIVFLIGSCTISAMGCASEYATNPGDAPPGDDPNVTPSDEAAQDLLSPVNLRGLEREPTESPDLFEDELLGGLSLLWVAADIFEMGMDPLDPDWTVEHGLRQVTLDQDWSISVTEVTAAAFIEYMGYDPSELGLPLNGPMSGSALYPVHSVSWYETAAFANAMSEAHGLEACYRCQGEGQEIYCIPDMNPYECDGFRLPTEAEWEYAARGEEPYGFPGSDDINAIGWWEENSDEDYHDVCTKQVNAYGLCDMGGNIREFVYDWTKPQSHEDQVNPVVLPREGVFPSERGGSFACRRPELLVNRRNLNVNLTGFERDMHSGFRIARSLH
jgi:sulfatase modifying factor 1